MASAGPKAFIVTGSSTGVGAATAVQLARRGACVVVNYSKSAGEAEETAQACTKAGGSAEESTFQNTPCGDVLPRSASDNANVKLPDTHRRQESQVLARPFATRTTRLPGEPKQHRDR